MRKSQLSFKQRVTLEYVTAYIDQNSCAPTFKEVADNFGITVHAADMRLRQCRDKGFISWKKHTPRSIELVVRGEGAADAQAEATEG